MLFHALRALGKSVEVMLPNAPDSRYGFLQAHTPWTLYQGQLPEADLLIVCDCNELTRLGEMGEAVAASAMPRMVLDHHPFENRDGWSASVLDPTAAASGLMAIEFAKELGVETLPPEAYEAAFTALMTDTGWLKYSNADARAWHAAGELVAHGVDTAKVYAQVYQQAEASRPRGITATLRNLEYLCEERIALLWVSDQELKEVGGSLEDTDEVLDLMRGVGSVEGVALLTEREDGSVKLSLRSKSVLDVNHLARRLGGGGHARAAGVTFDADLSLARVVERVRSALLEAEM